MQTMRPLALLCRQLSSHSEEVAEAERLSDDMTLLPVDDTLSVLLEGILEDAGTLMLALFEAVLPLLPSATLMLALAAVVASGEDEVLLAHWLELESEDEEVLLAHSLELESEEEALEELATPI